jgi:hypothetical protein
MSTLREFPRITPFLWFDSNAEEAVDFYLSVFKNSRRLGEFRHTLDFVRSDCLQLVRTCQDCGTFRRRDEARQLARQQG